MNTIKMDRQTYDEWCDKNIFDYVPRNLHVSTKKDIKPKLKPKNIVVIRNEKYTHIENVALFIKDFYIHNVNHKIKTNIIEEAWKDNMEELCKQLIRFIGKHTIMSIVKFIKIFNIAEEDSIKSIVPTEIKTLEEIVSEVYEYRKSFSKNNRKKFKELNKILQNSEENVYTKF